METSSCLCILLVYAPSDLTLRFHGNVCALQSTIYSVYVQYHDILTLLYVKAAKLEQKELDPFLITSNPSHTA